MKSTATIFALCMAALPAGGCDDNNSSGGADLSMSTIPTPPTLGVTIDRMGRPAINTALNNSFNPDDATKGVGKDEYNAEGNQANWPTLLVNNTPVVNELAANLAIIDALDGVCGNQLLSKGDASGDAGASEYATLPTVLVDDELYLDTSIADCTSAGGIPNYLAVEARAVNLPIPITTCGGRTPLDDVIDVSYTLLAGGLSGVPVGDGISADADPSTPASLTAFPFLNTPN